MDIRTAVASGLTTGLPGVASGALYAGEKHYYHADTNWERARQGRQSMMMGALRTTLT